MFRFAQFAAGRIRRGVHDSAIYETSFNFTKANPGAL
jgi:hypothetical protein